MHASFPPLYSPLAVRAHLLVASPLSDSSRTTSRTGSQCWYGRWSLDYTVDNLSISLLASIRFQITYADLISTRFSTRGITSARSLCFSYSLSGRIYTVGHEMTLIAAILTPPMHPARLIQLSFLGTTMDWNPFLLRPFVCTLYGCQAATQWSVSAADQASSGSCRALIANLYKNEP